MGLVRKLTDIREGRYYKNDWKLRKSEYTHEKACLESRGWKDTDVTDRHVYHWVQFPRPPPLKSDAAVPVESAPVKPKSTRNELNHSTFSSEEERALRKMGRDYAEKAKTSNVLENHERLACLKAAGVTGKTGTPIQTLAELASLED